MDRGELEDLDREALVIEAQLAGIRRARILTRPELIDELLRRDPLATDAELRKSRGFFGKARDLVARVVERGLHLPDAADRIRTLGDLAHSLPRIEPQIVPTVTLAEIYAAQGHRQRAIETLRRVLLREPEHVAARVLLSRLEEDGYVAPPPPLPPETEAEFAGYGSSDSNEPVTDHGDANTDAFANADAKADADVNADANAGAEALADDVDVGWEAPTLTTAILVREVRNPGGTEEGVAHEPDACVAIPLPPELPPEESGGRIYTRWRISSRTLERARQARPNGRFVVRACVVTPSLAGPTTETRDRDVAFEAEEATLFGVPEPSVVRVAIGWLDARTFEPFAHSPAFERREGRGLVMWTPAGLVQVALDDVRSSFLARAIEGARLAYG